MSDLKELVDRITADGVMTRQEHENFMDRVHKDGQIDEEESEQISRIFNMIKEGKLTIVDDERQAADQAREAETSEEESSDS